MKHSELRHQPRHVNPRIQDNNKSNMQKFIQDIDEADREIY